MHSIIHRNTLGDLPARTAARVPHKTALVWRGQRDTYADLDVLVNRCANAIAGHGIGKGDRVAMLAHNHREFVIVHFALARLGAISVPVNYMLNAADVAFILGHSG
ncbi:MAG: AMP-binding protein, partial [Rhodanobacteraceae bacterium]